MTTRCHKNIYIPTSKQELFPSPFFTHALLCNHFLSGQGKLWRHLNVIRSGKVSGKERSKWKGLKTSEAFQHPAVPTEPWLDTAELRVTVEAKSMIPLRHYFAQQSLVLVFLPLTSSVHDCP